MRRLLPAVLALLVVLAGCNGIALPGSDDGPSTAGPDGTDTGTPTAGTPGENVTADSVRNDTLAAIDAVETYRLTVNQTTEYADLDQTGVTDVSGAFDREARDAALEQNQTLAGLSFTVETYVDGDNETLYQYSPAYAQDFDSAWVSRDLSGNFSEAWERFDTLSRQRALLNVSNLTLDGVRTVDGTEVYVLQGTVDEDRLDELGVGTGENTTVSNVSATFYVNAEDATLVGSTVDFEGTERTEGRTLAFERTVEVRFGGYGEAVDVAVPEEAREQAVPAGNRTAGTA